jgi:hypothetical protein
MKMLSLAVFVFAMCIALNADEGMAQSAEDGHELLWSVYRDANGQLTKQSRRFARKMQEKAEENGHITLWLTANVAFNPYMDELTDQEIAEQNEMVWKFFEAVLQPLVDRGSVWHPKAGPNIAGPGCLVRANAVGVMDLVRDSRILHIIEVL